MAGTKLPNTVQAAFWGRAVSNAYFMARVIGPAQCDGRLQTIEIAFGTKPCVLYSLRRPCRKLWPCSVERTSRVHAGRTGMNRHGPCQPNHLSWKSKPGFRITG